MSSSATCSSPRAATAAQVKARVTFLKGGIVLSRGRAPVPRQRDRGLFHVTTDAWWLVIGNGNKRLFSLAVNLASVL